MSIGEILRELRERKDVETLEANVCRSHINVLVKSSLN